MISQPSSNINFSLVGTYLTPLRLLSLRHAALIVLGSILALRIIPVLRRTALSFGTMFSFALGTRPCSYTHTSRLSRRLFDYDILHPRIIATQVGSYAIISESPQGREHSIATVYTPS